MLIYFNLQGYVCYGKGKVFRVCFGKFSTTKPIKRVGGVRFYVVVLVALSDSFSALCPEIMGLDVDELSLMSD